MNEDALNKKEAIEVEIIEASDNYNDKEFRSNESQNDDQNERTYTITELADEFQKSPATIRHWEKEMRGLIKVKRSVQGFRYYTENDRKIFSEINRWRNEGFPLDTIYTFLRTSNYLGMLNVKGNSRTQVDNDPQAQGTQVVHDELLSEIKSLKNTIDQFKNYSEQLMLGDGISEEEKRIRERTEEINREVAKRRVEARLKARALREWAKQPESRRYIKNGLFRKEENMIEREAFIAEFIAEHFEEEIMKEFNN